MDLKYHVCITSMYGPMPYIDQMELVDYSSGLIGASLSDSHIIGYELRE